MYKISLSDLTEDARDFSFRVPKDKPLFKTPIGEFSSDLDIWGTIVKRDDDFFIISMEVKTDAAVPCRRCLKTCDINIHLKKELYIKRGSYPEEESYDDYIVISPDEREIELENPLNELLLLEFPAYPLCDSDCKGLCPNCGRDLNEGKCDCKLESIDPRWEALRKLRDRDEQQ
ncbi:MAG: DUF177 domain-containing protein [Candidatus Glassbacteria bacterium]